MKNLKSIVKQNIFEGVRDKDLQKYLDVIEKYFKKYNIYSYKDLSSIKMQGEGDCWSILIFHPDTNICAIIHWKKSGSRSEVDGVSFVRDVKHTLYQFMWGGNLKLDFTIILTGASMGVILPIISDIILGSVPYNKTKILNVFNKGSIRESAEDIETLRKRRNNLSVKRSDWRKRGKDTTELDKEIESIKATIASLRAGVTVDVQPFMDIYDVEQEFEERATPHERFSDMEHYLDMVIKGVQPSLLICGAPGVGKTFRVMKKIKSSGKNYIVIKGKETAAALYTDLFRTKHENDILIADDADELLTDETSTNLLKAATDSSDERIISYGTSKPPQMNTEEYYALDPDDQALCSQLQLKGGGEVIFFPRSFETKGSVVIITNRNAGQIDTAVRNRGLICDLSFTNQECLDLIKDLMVVIMPDKLDMNCKTRALKYLQEVCDSGSQMAISIRSFTTCAKVFSVIDDDDKQAERMIKEQMKLQSLRGGKKY